ncbi:thioesterase [Glycocaulis profundi]|nr:thioesterase [Glycocaulis profundi]
MIELWRGNANAWECDELGHLNVRGYIAKAMQAAGRLAELIGMRGAFASHATATLIARDIHVRYLAEVRPGAPLAIEGGVERVSGAGLEALFLMRHAARGDLAATIRIAFDHADPASARPFPWPERLGGAARGLIIPVPPEAAPRGVSSGIPTADISAEQAEALGLPRIGLGRFGPEDADAFGRIRPEVLIGKVSDSAVHAREAFPEQWAAHETGALTHASALLEARIAVRRLPRPGEGYEIRTGLIEAGPKVRRLVHWVLDPATGAALWSAEGVACIMDMKTRRLAPAEGDALAALRSAIRPGLSL